MEVCKEGEEQGERDRGKERGRGRRPGRGRESKEEERFKEPPGYKTLCFVTSENIGTHITTSQVFAYSFWFFNLFQASEDSKTSERRNILEGFL